jgi:hypothetical protein
MSGASVALTVALLCCCAALAATQSIAGLPVRNLTVSGATFTSDGFVDIPLFGKKIGPLDDGRESPPPPRSLGSQLARAAALAATLCLTSIGHPL